MIKNFMRRVEVFKKQQLEIMRGYDESVVDNLDLSLLFSFATIHSDVGQLDDNDNYNSDLSNITIFS